MSRLLILALFLSVSCTSCEKSGRTDVVRNEALKESCTSGAIIEIMKLDKQIGREYACGCVHGAVKSTANNCESIINLNNSLEIIAACKPDLGSNADCRRVFAERK